MPRREDFQRALDNIFRMHEDNGDRYVDVTARELHKSIGGYPGPSQRLPVCCDVMRQNMQDSDEVLAQPPKGKGASLRIRYMLPRPVPKSGKEAMPGKALPTAPAIEPKSTRAYQASAYRERTLFVISCTRKKIWIKDDSKPHYVPLKLAYVGTTMTRWLDEYDIKFKEHPWIVLSAKYGFIEPEHPIGDYDIAFSDENTGPISDESLKRQVMCQPRRLNGKDHKLSDFEVVVVKGSRIYLEKVRQAFRDTGATVVTFKEYSANRRDVESR